MHMFLDRTRWSKTHCLFYPCKATCPPAAWSAVRVVERSKCTAKIARVRSDGIMQLVSKPIPWLVEFRSGLVKLIVEFAPPETVSDCFVLFSGL